MVSLWMAIILTHSSVWERQLLDQYIGGKHGYHLLGVHSGVESGKAYGHALTCHSCSKTVQMGYYYIATHTHTQAHIMLIQLLALVQLVRSSLLVYFVNKLSKVFRGYSNTASVGQKNKANHLIWQTCWFWAEGKGWAIHVLSCCICVACYGWRVCTAVCL